MSNGNDDSGKERAEESDAGVNLIPHEKAEDEEDDKEEDNDEDEQDDEDDKEGEDDEEEKEDHFVEKEEVTGVEVEVGRGNFDRGERGWTVGDK